MMPPPQESSCRPSLAKRAVWADSFARKPSSPSAAKMSGDAAAVGLDDLLVEVDELFAQPLGQCTAHRGFSTGGHSDEGHVEHIAAERGSDAADLPCCVVELPAEEVFGGVHGLRHQHLEAAHSHRDPGLFGPEDELRLIGVVHHVQHSFQPGIFATSRLHTPTLGYIPAGVVLMTICAPLDTASS